MFLSAASDWRMAAAMPSLLAALDSVQRTALHAIATADDATCVERAMTLLSRYVSSDGLLRQLTQRDAFGATPLVLACANAATLQRLLHVCSDASEEVVLAALLPKEALLACIRNPSTDSLRVLLMHARTGAVIAKQPDALIGAVTACVRGHQSAALELLMPHLPAGAHAHAYAAACAHDNLSALLLLLKYAHDAFDESTCELAWRVSMQHRARSCAARIASTPIFLQLAAGGSDVSERLRVQAWYYGAQALLPERGHHLSSAAVDSAASFLPPHCSEASSVTVGGMHVDLRLDVPPAILGATAKPAFQLVGPAVPAAAVSLHITCDLHHREFVATFRLLDTGTSADGCVAVHTRESAVDNWRRVDAHVLSYAFPSACAPCFRVTAYACKEGCLPETFGSGMLPLPSQSLPASDGTAASLMRVVGRTRGDVSVDMYDLSGSRRATVAATFTISYSSCTSIPDHVTVRSKATCALIGHRGSGADNSTCFMQGAHDHNEHCEPGPHYLENTLSSFVAAAAHGADFIEFDVQLTRDGVPVLHHDWAVKVRVGDTFIRVPVCNLTAAQFCHIPPAYMHNSGGTSESAQSAACDAALVQADAQVPLTPDHEPTTDVTIIRDAFFITLEQLFQAVPSSCGFNVEVKYPVPQEVHMFGLSVAERGAYVDAILRVVERYACQGRRIMFSCFDPDTCVMLARKQAEHSVLFLTEGGAHDGPVFDPRMTSLDGAVRFVLEAGLAGIVTDVTPVIACPALIPAIQRARQPPLLLASYGRSNNDPKVSLMQRDAGIDAVIVDHIRKTAAAWHVVA